MRKKERSKKKRNLKLLFLLNPSLMQVLIGELKTNLERLHLTMQKIIKAFIRLLNIGN